MPMNGWRWGTISGTRKAGTSAGSISSARRAGGRTRFSGAAQITKANVARLAVAWTYHTGEAARRGAAFKRSAFQATPVLADGKLVFCTPFDRVVALDPASGAELWVFDPELSPTLKPANDFKCRGVAL